MAEKIPSIEHHIKVLEMEIIRETEQRARMKELLEMVRDMGVPGPTSRYSLDFIWKRESDGEMITASWYKDTGYRVYTPDTGYRHLMMINCVRAIKKFLSQ